jgi:hypothetical protein
VDEGRIAGFKAVLFGMHNGRSVIECRFVGKLGHDRTPNWRVQDGYVVDIEDDPSVRVRLEPIGPHFDGATTDMPVVNAISQVVAAPSGIVNAAQLPFVMRSNLLSRVANEELIERD